jgi:protein tyrosine phosphatase (PTP) superfamily phosphohydrolase (DUF442 family)
MTLSGAPSSIPGVPRFVRVDDRVARGGQPTAEGLRNLADAGFRTIVDLRGKDERWKDEKKLAEALGIKYVNVPMQGMHTPHDRQIARALKALADERAGPVFVHCKRGADRTGVVIACYRMEHDGWSNREALQEARDLGMYWYQFPLQRYIQSYRPQGDRNSVVEGAEGVVDGLKRLPSAVGDIFK